MLSPTKSHMLMNKYFKYSDDKKTRVEKLCSYSDTKSSDAYDFINEFLGKCVYKNRQVWMMSKTDDKITVKQSSIYELIELEDEKKMMGYVENESLKFSLDYDDAVVTNITKICKLSTQFKLI